MGITLLFLVVTEIIRIVKGAVFRYTGVLHVKDCLDGGGCAEACSAGMTVEPEQNYRTARRTARWREHPGCTYCYPEVAPVIKETAVGSRRPKRF